MQQSINNADHIFVVNDFMKQRTHEITGKNNINILPAGYNEKIFFPIKKQEARKELGLSIESKIIINISSLDDNKNIGLFIDGFSNILPKFPNLKGYIIGDGRNFSLLNQHITELGLEHRIQLMGALPHQNINLWINASDFVTLCSFIEGSPTVMYETLACGRPLLGSAVGGIPEVITSSDFGSLFNPYKIEEYTTKMEHMLTQTFDEKKIIAYSLQYSQKSLGQKILTVYDNLLN